VAGNAANGKRAAFDLEAAAAAAVAETGSEPFAFTYRGEQYEMPPSNEWPVSVLRTMSQGDLDGAMSALLGEEAYAQLCDAGLKLGELTKLFDQVAQQAGFQALPNSKALAPRASVPT
jgi:hypothetical protein